MRFVDLLARAERRNDSLLCVGLDPEAGSLPSHWRNDPARIFDFCAAIVDATKDLVIAYKPQIAHFASQRAEAQLERLIEHIHDAAPEIAVILDAKRGDIGSTATHYAREAFDRYGADAVTLSPFLGFDSIEPYLQYPEKGTILLCRTSNPGGSDFQAQRLETGDLLYEHIAKLASGDWNRTGQMSLVVGATFPGEIARVRELAPTLPLLIPGVGAQGGDAAAAVTAGWRGTRAEPAVATTGPVLVNSSRAVLYAGADRDFAEAARQVALTTRAELNRGRVLDSRPVP